jgi:ribulose-phosphate 3-epimerase
MSVNPGFGGQLFIPTTFPKIRRLHELLAGRGVEISVDGGVKLSNAGDLAAAGAQVLVAGSAIFEAADPVRAIQALRGAAEVSN